MPNETESYPSRNLEKPREKSKTAAVADAAAEKLTAPQTPEAKADGIIFEIATAGKKLFKDPNISPNTVFQIVSKAKPYILNKLKEGAQYVGYSKGGLVLNWFKDGKATEETNPIFLAPQTYNLLSYDAKSTIQQKQLEKRESNFVEAAKAQLNLIGSYLQQTGLIDRKLTSVQIQKSDFGKEMTALLLAGYKAGTPYVFQPEPNGFILKNYFGGLTDQKFDFRTYDKNLNFPKELEKSAEQKAYKFINEVILPYLRSQRPVLTDGAILNSDLVQDEVKPILITGFEGNKPCSFEESATGFSLKSGLLGLNNQPPFNLNQYDQNLSLKAMDTPQKIKAESPDESINKINQAHEKHEEKLNKENEENARIKEIQAAQFPAEKAAFDKMRQDREESGIMPNPEEVRNQLDSLAAKDPSIAEINKDVSPLLDYLKDEMATGNYQTHEEKRALMDKVGESFKNSQSCTTLEKVRNGDNLEDKAATELYEGFLEGYAESLLGDVDDGHHEHGSHSHHSDD